MGSLPFPGRILRRTWCLRVAQTLISKRKSHQNRLDRPPWPTFRARKIFSPGAFGVGFAVYVGAMGRFGVGPGSKNADYVIWVQTESRVRVSVRTRTYARVPGMRVRMLPRKGQEKGSLWLLIGRVRISSVAYCQKPERKACGSPTSHLVARGDRRSTMIGVCT